METSALIFFLAANAIIIGITIYLFVKTIKSSKRGIDDEEENRLHVTEV